MDVGNVEQLQGLGATAWVGPVGRELKNKELDRMRTLIMGVQRLPLFKTVGRSEAGYRGEKFWVCR